MCYYFLDRIFKNCGSVPSHVLKPCLSIDLKKFYFKYIDINTCIFFGYRTSVVGEEGWE